MKAVLFTKLLECEIAVVESLDTDIHLDIVRSENDVVSQEIYDFALFDLTWTDDFIGSKLHSLNAPGVAIVQLESPTRLANAYLSGIRAMVFMESIREDIKNAVARIKDKKASFSPAVAKSMLKILGKQSEVSKMQIRLLTWLSKGSSVFQISDALGLSIEDIDMALWALCSQNDQNSNADHHLKISLRRDFNQK